MKRNLFFSLLVMCAIVTLSSCKKEYLIDVTGSLTGVVNDYVTSQPISGVNVSVVLSDQTVLKDSTNSLGYYTIKGVPVGDYVVLFSKSGYASMRSKISIQPANEAENTTSGKKESYQTGVSSDVTMHQTIGKLTGVVTLNGANVSGANVMIAFNNSSIYAEPALYSTTTGTNGVYSFSNLPVGMSFTVTAYSSSASGSDDIYGLAFDNSIVPYVKDISISESSLSLVNYTGKGSNVKVDTTIASVTLTFSQPISQSITNNHNGGGVHLMTGSGTEVLTTATYNGNTITLNIVGGALVSNSFYWFEYSVYAADNNSTSSDSYGFYTKEQHAVISSLQANIAVTATQITVNNVPAVSGGVKPGAVVDFDVYYKPNNNEGQTEYRKITIGAITGTTTRIISGSFAVGTYYVVPKVTGFDGVTVYGVSSSIGSL